MNKVISVKKFNENQKTKWLLDFNEAWEEGFSHPKPSILAYTYQKNYGYVAIFDGGSKWFDKKSKAIDYVVSLTKEQTNDR